LALDSPNKSSNDADVVFLGVGAAFCAVAGFFCLRRWSVFWTLRWHPRFAFVLQASRLCGAAPTFLCRRKEK
jgi:hypothetical protein